MSFDKSQTIDRYLNKYGRDMAIETEDGTKIATRAVIQRTWNKTRYRFEDKATKIGQTDDRYYYYIGSPYLDITRLSKDATVTIDDNQYCFISQEAVKVGDNVQYYRGVLKKIEEADGNVFQR